MNTPDYIVIGETKCGTTSLFNYLIQHPNILDTFGNGDKVDEMYRTKEIRFFDRYYNKGFDWYKSCFPKTKSGEITGEATPMYMYRAMVPFRIKQHLPKAKFIVLLRNPIDRLYSNFQHYSKWVPNFSDQYPSIENYLNSCSDRDFFMIDKGIYVKSLEIWHKYFNPDQFHVTSTEQMYENPQEIYSKILNFLELDDYKLEKFEHFRVNSYQTIEANTRSTLQEFYAPFNEQLFELIGKRFNWNDKK